MVELVEKRYGSAIFELAKEEDAVEALQKEILAIQDSFLEEDFKAILSHPKVAMKEKIKLVEDIFTDRISKNLVGLFVLVIRKGRQASISDILSEVLVLIDTYQGKMKAYISSPNTLSDEQKKTIEDQLQSMTKKEIIPIYDIDESLIGGLIIRIGDRIVDNSIKGHLHTLSRELLETKMTIS